MGLGNPGSRYARTRHNLGFMVVDNLGRNIRSKPVPSAIPARLSRGTVVTADGEEAVFLVQPTTYMNHSGQALESLVAGGVAQRRPLEPAGALVDDRSLQDGAAGGQRVPRPCMTRASSRAESSGRLSLARQTAFL